MIFRYALILLLLVSCQIEASLEANRILYLIQSEQLDRALEIYREHVSTLHHHDSHLLQQIGLKLLDQGYRSSDPEVQLLTLFGAGISNDERALYILFEGVKSSVPQLQLISLNFLSHFQNDEADAAMQRAMGSDFLLIRLEGAYQMAQKKSPKAVPQTEALMYKVDPSLHAVFPQLFAMTGTVEAIKMLRKLLVHSHEDVRVAAVLSAAQFGRDDLLADIRRLATHPGIAQQEACAWSLGALKDESSITKLEQLATSREMGVKLAALQSLYHLGQRDKRTSIEEIAKTQDPFAIQILGEVEESQETLVALMQSNNIHTRINAALALLDHKDERALTPLCDILIKDARDFACIAVNSHGGALTAFKVIPSAQQNLQENPMGMELSLNIREEILKKAASVNEKAFLKLAETLFEQKQNDLIPTLVEILEAMHTPATVALLKKYHQHAGAPLIRNYCNLALYRMKEEGPYGDNLKAWIAKQQDDFIFRPFVPWEMREDSSPYHLTPQETSRLLIDSFETIIGMQDESGIDILLRAIEKGNPKNRYALAGLLMRASY